MCEIITLPFLQNFIIIKVVLLILKRDRNRRIQSVLTKIRENKIKLENSKNSFPFNKFFPICKQLLTTFIHLLDLL
jgi:hypothetical protein